MTAFVRCILDGAFSDQSEENTKTRVEEVVFSVDRVITGFVPEVQKELRQLFSLISFAPTRALVAGRWGSWHRADNEAVTRFLEGWRDSQYELFQSAYDALVQLTVGSWYGSESSWSEIGYPGPPNFGT